eukprot:5264688-Prymnesium_polylepis.2
MLYGTQAPCRLRMFKLPRRQLSAWGTLKLSPCARLASQQKSSIDSSNPRSAGDVSSGNHGWPNMPSVPSYQLLPHSRPSRIKSKNLDAAASNTCTDRSGHKLGWFAPTWHLRVQVLARLTLNEVAGMVARMRKARCPVSPEVEPWIGTPHAPEQMAFTP